jgi:hypothetical protein
MRAFLQPGQQGEHILHGAGSRRRAEWTLRVQAERKILEDRHIAEQLPPLGDGAETEPYTLRHRHRRHIAAGVADAAGHARQQSQDGLQQCALARAIGAQHRNQFALVQMQIEVVQHPCSNAQIDANDVGIVRDVRGAPVRELAPEIQNHDAIHQPHHQ